MLGIKEKRTILKLTMLFSIADPTTYSPNLAYVISAFLVRNIKYFYNDATMYFFLLINKFEFIFISLLKIIANGCWLLN